MNKFLAELPSTNFKTFITMMLVSLTILIVLGALVLQKGIDATILGEVFTFEAALLGINYFQFAKKRDTYEPAPPAAPDVEDASAAHPEDSLDVSEDGSVG